MESWSRERQSRTSVVTKTSASPSTCDFNHGHIVTHKGKKYVVSGEPTYNPVSKEHRVRIVSTTDPKGLLRVPANELTLVTPS